MPHPFKVFPVPPGVTLRRICLAQAIVSISALGSTVLLLSKVVPTIVSGLP